MRSVLWLALALRPGAQQPPHLRGGTASTVDRDLGYYAVFPKFVSIIYFIDIRQI